MTIKFYHRGVHALFLIISEKQMINYYAPCFNRIDFIIIPSYIKLPCLHQGYLQMMSTDLPITPDFRTFTEKIPDKKLQNPQNFP